MLTTSKLLAGLLKEHLKTQEKLKELELMHQNPIISVFLDIAKNADVSRNQGACHVILIFFESSIGKVYLRQISSLYDICDRF